MNYQVFISRKKSEISGQTIPEELIARELHRRLEAVGIRTFLDDVSLAEAGTAHYKIKIDEALDSASILVAVGSSSQNLESRWVRYEWDSFFNDIISDIKPHGQVFCLTSQMHIHELPRSLRQTQCFDYEHGGLDHLCEFIHHALANDATQPDDPGKRFVCCLDFSDSLNLYSHGVSHAQEAIQTAYEIVSEIVADCGGVSSGPHHEEVWISLDNPQAGIEAVEKVMDSLSKKVYPGEMQFKLKGAAEYREATIENSDWSGIAVELVNYIKRFAKKNQIVSTGSFGMEPEEISPLHQEIYQWQHRGRHFFQRDSRVGSKQLKLFELNIGK